MLRNIIFVLCTASSLDARVEALTRAARLLHKAERAHARGDMARHKAAAAAAEAAMQGVEPGPVAEGDVRPEEVEALLQWHQELERFYGQVDGRPVVIGEEESLAGRPVVAWPADSPDKVALKAEAILAAIDQAPTAADLERLAERRRAAADGVHGPTEAWYHTLSVHFMSRQKMANVRRSARDAKRLAVQELGQDFLLVKRARAMTDEDLEVLLHDDDALREDQRNLVSALIGQRAAQARMIQGKKKAVVFSCAFGDGHKSAAAAVKQYLAAPQRGEPADGLANYEVEVIDTTKDPRFLVEAWYNSLGIRDEDIFNKIVLKNQWYALHNLYDSVMENVYGQLVKPCPTPGCDNPRKQQFRAALLQIQPEVVISVYHMELMPILELARELGGLPHVHIATDMDIKMKEVFTQAGPAPVYPRFKTSVPFDIDASYVTLAPLPTKKDDASHFLSGYPVRAPFLLPPKPDAELQALRAERYPGCGGDKGCLVVLVMTGGGGQDVPFPYLLADSGYLEDPEQPVHVLVIAGGNNALHGDMQKKLTGTVEFAGKTLMQGSAKSVTVEIVQDPKNLVLDEARPDDGKRPYYVLEDELALLMDLADVIITKPGGGTTAEVAYRRLPAVFDATHGLLHWEGFTVDVFVGAGRGVKLEKPPIVHWPSFAAKQLSRKLAEAWAMGKTGPNAHLAQDPTLAEGEVLQPRKHIRNAVNEVVQMTSCRRCEVFPSDAPDVPVSSTNGRARNATATMARVRNDRASLNVNAVVVEKSARRSAAFVDISGVEFDQLGTVRRQ